MESLTWPDVWLDSCVTEDMLEHVKCQSSCSFGRLAAAALPGVYRHWPSVLKATFTIIINNNNNIMPHLSTPWARKAPYNIKIVLP